MESQRLQLALRTPVGLASGGGRFWIADASSRSVTAFDPRCGEQLAEFALDGEPLAVAAMANLVIVGTQTALVAVDVQAIVLKW